MKITDVDVHILNELKEDARLSMRELSKRVNLSAPAVAERVRKLEDAGIIEGYSVQVNYKKLGLMIDCLLEVTVLNGEYQRFVAFMNQHPRAFLLIEWQGSHAFSLSCLSLPLKKLKPLFRQCLGLPKQYLISSYQGTLFLIPFRNV